ncbi:MAG: protease complex subunit PrcB family protein [Lachnospiraceae bacterium]|nr:protease complex subunit PrcB family protein [Lachnospiraceae bacterium]MDE6626930.1 protease complex subunit PrcB family protein [Lachnospiraceae bacterium]
MKRCKYIFLLAMFAIFLVSVLTGCRIEETNEEKIKDLDYTICDESKLPDALVDLIQEKRKEPFKLTYRTRDYLYIVVGYGAQDRTDLNVLLTELYLTKNAIFVDTELTAVEDTTLEDNMVSYPWIAVKCELYDVQIIFR